MARIDTAADLALIEALRKGKAARLTNRALAEQLGYSLNTIRRRCADHGIAKAPLPPKQRPVSLRDRHREEILELRASGATQMQLAAKYGCSQSTIANICRGTTGNRAPRISVAKTALNIRGLDGYLRQRNMRLEERQARIARGGRP